MAKLDKLFPKLNINISGKGNIVISSDGNIHKIQIPYQIENHGLSSGHIEEMQVSLFQNNKKGPIELPWRKFIYDISGSATSPISNPYRFLIEPKSTVEKFIEFLAEETIEFTEAIYEVQSTAIVSYYNKNKNIKIVNNLVITKEILSELKKNRELARMSQAPILISVSVPPKNLKYQTQYF